MAAEPEPSIAPEQPRRSLPRRLALFILAAGAVASASVLIPNVPRERRVELRLDAPATIVGVSVEWVPSRAAVEEAVHGATWHFSAGSAPPSVITTVHLPDGPYDLHVLVERAERTDEVRRSLTLGDVDQIAVPLR